jgi:ADP-ribose pyrophosphatase
VTGGLAGDLRLADPDLAALFSGPGGPERLAFWQEATGGLAAPDRAVERRLAADILAAWANSRPPACAAPAGRCWCARPRPCGPRPRAAAGGRAMAPSRSLDAAIPSAASSAVEDLRCAIRRFDGSMGPAIRREVFVMTDAVTVLPWDPVRDLVLVVEQFRAGPWAGAAGRSGIEAVAGRIDPGETPEDTARREAAEEAALYSARSCRWPAITPAPAPVRIYPFLRGTLRSGAAMGGLHGVADEGEDIRTHLSWPSMPPMERAGGGRIGNAPLLISLLWLMRQAPGCGPAPGFDQILIVPAPGPSYRPARQGQEEP